MEVFSGFYESPGPPSSGDAHSHSIAPLHRHGHRNGPQWRCMAAAAYFDCCNRSQGLCYGPLKLTKAEECTKEVDRILEELYSDIKHTPLLRKIKSALVEASKKIIKIKQNI